MEPRRLYPSDVSDEEWAFAAPYLALLPEGAGQRRHDLRAVYDALRAANVPEETARAASEEIAASELSTRELRRTVEEAIAGLSPEQFRVIVASNRGKPIALPDYVHVDGDEDNMLGQGHITHLNLPF